MASSSEIPPIDEGQAEDSSPIIDVELPKDRLFGLGAGLFFMVVLVFSIVVSAVAAGMDLVSHPVVLCGLCIGTFILCYFLTFLAVKKHVYHRVRHLCARHADATTAQLVRTVVDDFARPGESTLVQSLAYVLAQNRDAGIVVRCSAPTNRDVVMPVSFSFEPLLLNESDEATAEFRNAIDESEAGGDALHDPAWRNKHKSMLGRHMERRRKLTGMARWWFVLLATGIGLFLVGSVASRNYSLVAITIAGIASSILAGVDQESCFVVPGGVLAISGGMRRRRFTLYERSQSVLVVLHSRLGLWFTSVSDGTSSHFTSVTRDEVNLLLRCWLSPLKPWPLERYTDLLTAET